MPSKKEIIKRMRYFATYKKIVLDGWAMVQCLVLASVQAPPVFLSGFFFQLTGLIRFTKARSDNLDEEMNERTEEKTRNKKRPTFTFEATKHRQRCSVLAFKN